MNLAIIPCSSGIGLAEKIYSCLNNNTIINREVDYIVPNKTIFANNEMLLKFNASVRGKDVFIVQTFDYSKNPSEDLVELLIAADTAFTSSARRVSVVIPTIYGARQDRKTGARTTVTIATIAKLLKAVHVDRVLTVSLHSPQSAAAFYAVGMAFDNLSTADIFLPELKELHKNLDFVIISPDVGGLQKARFYAKELDANLAFADKRRLKANCAEILNLVGNVEDRNCLIIDDMIDTGGSIIEVSKKIRELKAKEIYCLTTHLILSDDAQKKLDLSSIRRIYGTDTVPHQSINQQFYVKSVDKLLAKTINNIHKDAPVSDLYEHKLA